MAISTDTFQDFIFPVIIAIVIVNVYGFLGNLTVLIIYSVHFPKTHFRCLVLALAIVDFISCCTTVPMETISTWYWFRAQSRWLCKAKNFCVQLTALSAMFMLFVTAVYKHRRICTPFKKQLSQKVIVLLCLAGALKSAVFAVPAALLWDINNHTVNISNTTEEIFVCEVQSAFSATNYPTLYRVLLSTYNIYLLTTVVLYTLVARSVIVHVRQLKKLRKTKTKDVTSNLPTISKLIANLQGLNKSSAKSLNSANSHISAAVIRKIITMVIIAATFSATFILGLSFGYVFAIRSNSDFSSNMELVTYFALYRFYFINYALNSVVYFSLDKRFREEVVKFLSCRS